ncbi:hypothetical protein BH09PLA1_BH09PLA1_36650 [soil metagenome]
MNMIFNRRIVLMIVAIFASGTLALGAPTKKELQARAEKRYPQIMQYKADGKLGETSEGFIEAVKDTDGAMTSLIDEENADRRALYQLIADDDKKVTVEIVARRAAERNFQRAKKGEYLKDHGTWRQK